MDNDNEAQLKKEIEEISNRIDNIVKKLSSLDPTKQEPPQSAEDSSQKE